MFKFFWGKNIEESNSKEEKLAETNNSSIDPAKLKEKEAERAPISKTKLSQIINNEISQILLIQRKVEEIINNLSARLEIHEGIVEELVKVAGDQEILVLKATTLSAELQKTKEAFKEQLNEVSTTYKQYALYYEVFEITEKELLQDLLGEDARKFKTMINNYVSCRHDYFSFMVKEITSCHLLKVVVEGETDFVGQILNDSSRRAISDPEKLNEILASIKERFETQKKHFLDIKKYFENTKSLDIKSVGEVVMKSIEKNMPSAVKTSLIKKSKLKNIGLFLLKKDEKAEGLPLDINSLIKYLKETGLEEDSFKYHAKNHDFSKWIGLTDPEFSLQIKTLERNFDKGRIISLLERFSENFR